MADRKPNSILHAPALDRPAFDPAEDDVFDEQADHDDGQQAAEHFGDVELVFGFKNEPAEATLAGRHAEHEFSGDQGAPGECPADFEACQDRRERRWDQD